MSIVLVGLHSIGCKRQDNAVTEVAMPEVVTNRMVDATYRGALIQNRREQTRIAEERSQIVTTMQEMIERVRATLPKGADDAAIRAELAKDPVWQRLEAQNQKKIKEIEQALAKTRELVRQRVKKEAQDVQAVADGKARPITGNQTQPQ